MRPTTRAAAVIMLVSLLAAACGTNAPAIPEPAGPLPPIENAATLPALYVPDDSRGAWTATAADSSGECDGYLCVPAGVYQQQWADGDWCGWRHHQAGFEDYLDMLQEDPSAESWKDADWTLITLKEGEVLSYWPTTGARVFSQGRSLRDAEGNQRRVPGDGQQRGCAEWVQVGTLEDAVPLPEPTKAECQRLIDEGEAAIEGVDEGLKRAEAYLEQPGAAVTWDVLWGVMAEAAAALIDAEPKAERTSTCYWLLGHKDAAREAGNAAWIFRQSLLLLRNECLTAFEFAPAGFDCSRLGQS